MSIIIHKQDNGAVSVVRPSPEALKLFTLDQIARASVPAPKKVWDVPTGRFEIDEETGEEYEVMDSRMKEYPYKIVSDTDLPEDLNEFWDAYTVDDSELTDGVGGALNV